MEKKRFYEEKYNSTNNVSHYTILQLFYNIAVKWTKTVLWFYNFTFFYNIDARGSMQFQNLKNC